MKFSYFSYFLNFQPSLAKTNGRSGFLLKIVFEDGHIGFADCHPWPEVGDEPIFEHFNSINSGQFTKLIQSAIESAKNYKVENVDLPKSHFLGFDLINWNQKKSELVIHEGFTHIKFKLGKNLQSETDCLIEILKNNPSLLVRLDFNNQLNSLEFANFLNKIEKWQKQIDFIEDPFSFETTSWSNIQAYGWNLACDRDFQQSLGSTQAAKVIILKPALLTHFNFANSQTNQRKIVTSYAGHPVEQISAAKQALKLSFEKEVHGLLSHRIYEKNQFSELFNWSGNNFHIDFAEFDKRLHQLEWKYF